MFLGFRVYIGSLGCYPTGRNFKSGSAKRILDMAVAEKKACAIRNGAPLNFGLNPHHPTPNPRS